MFFHDVRAVRELCFWLPFLHEVKETCSEQICTTRLSSGELDANSVKRWYEFMNFCCASPLWYDEYPQMLIQLRDKYPGRRVLIQELNFLETRAVLTKCVREDHFCEGALRENIRSGIFIQVIEHLRDLTEKP